MKVEELIPGKWYHNKYGDIFQVEKEQIDFGSFNYINRWAGSRTKGENGLAHNPEWERSAIEATLEEIQFYIKDYKEIISYDIY